MKAIVTGGCGFIGSHLVDLLLEKGFEVTAIDNFSTGRPQNLEHHKGNEKLRVVEADISDDEANLKQLFEGSSYVFHLAALADIVPSVKDPSTYFKSNVTGTLKVLEAVKETENLKKLVYAASASCYGLPDDFPTKEEAEIRLEYPYALTKRLGEEMVMHWGKLYNIPANSLRFFNAYGPRSRTSGTYGAVFGVFLAQKIAGKPFTVVGDGNQTRDFTYVSDIVSAVYAAANTDVSGEIMNVGSDGTYSINKLVELLGGEITYIPKRPGEPDCTFADISKIKKLLNWSPKVKFDDGVREMIKHIDYWKDAPVWTPETIKEETKAWFEALESN